MTAVVAAALAVAVVAIGSVTFYALSNRPSTTATSGYSPIVDDFRALEASRPAPTPPSTTGQGGAR